MPDRRLRPVRDDHLAALDLVIREDVFDHALQTLAGQRPAVDLEAGAVRLRAPQQLARRVERRLARFLRVANPAQLGLVLRAAAVVEEVALDDELDPVRTQMVCMSDRKALRDGGALDPELAAGANSQLEHDFPPLQALSEELVGTEVLERHDLQLGRVRSHARNLEGVEDRDPAVTLLGVEERVRDGNGHLVAQFGRSDRVAVDQHVGHCRILTGALRQQSRSATT